MLVKEVLGHANLQIITSKPTVLTILTHRHECLDAFAVSSLFITFATWNTTQLTRHTCAAACNWQATVCLTPNPTPW